MSTATVSRVLSHAPVVRAETRDVVLRAANSLSYVPNSAAKSLRTLRSGRLLVTLPTIANPFFALVMRGIEGSALAAGYSVLLGATENDRQREERYAEMLLRREADGLIMLGPRLPKAAVDFIRSMAPRQAPVVNGGEFTPGIGVPSLHIDNVRAGWEAMDHLCSLGHRRIGVLRGTLDSVNSSDRLEGATLRARQQGEKVEVIVEEGNFSVEAGDAAAERMLAARNPPTAIFSVSDEMAIGILHAARRHGIAVPGDLSIVGFDDIRFARFTEPPLTTVRMPMRELGEGAVRLVLDILRGDGKPVASVTLPHELIVRSSTAPPPARLTPETVDVGRPRHGPKRRLQRRGTAGGRG